jgi:alanine racemase
VTASIQPSQARPERSEGTRAWLEVDLARLVANARTVASTAGAPILPMVKANGYGLGAVACARALEAVDPWGFGVATMAEAEELRAAGIARPIVVFTPWVSGVESPESRVHGVRRVIGDVAGLESWLGDNSQLSTLDPLPFHLEIDTGMARAGIRWDDHAALQRASELVADAVGWEGVFTHFHSSDIDQGSTDLQWDRFVDALCWFPRRPPLVHVANSAGALRGKMYAADLVRPGIFLYGGGVGDWALAPTPVAALKSRIVALRTLQPGDTVSYLGTWRADRPTEIATIGCGYADGLLRTGSGRVRVEVNGVVVPTVGRITMDMTMMALPSGAGKLGDVVTIFGGKVSLAEYAEAMGTNVYEALTAIGPRVPRVYSGR